jgi:hypothetical protein
MPAAPERIVWGIEELNCNDDANVCGTDWFNISDESRARDRSALRLSTPSYK